MAVGCMAGEAGGTPAVTDDDIEAASARALAWIEAHPASPADGGLTDMIDEAVCFSVLSDLTLSESRRETFSGAFSRRMRVLIRAPAMQRWVDRPHKPLIEHYHLVLAARLSELVGQPSPLLTRIANAAQQALGVARHAPPSVRLTTALFLSRLSAAPAIDLAPLLSNSLIARLAQDPRLIALPGPQAGAQHKQLATWLVYALVHEVIALTDFGRTAPPPWLAARRDAVSAALLDALPWAAAQHNLDLVAELTVTLHLLGQSFNKALRDALHQLLLSQKADGSWGASATTARPNKVRHSVLTGSAALLAWLAWRQTDSGVQDALPARQKNRASGPASARPPVLASLRGHPER